MNRRNFLQSSIVVSGATQYPVVWAFADTSPALPLAVQGLSRFEKVGIAAKNDFGEEVHFKDIKIDKNGLIATLSHGDHEFQLGSVDDGVTWFTV